MLALAIISTILLGVLLLICFTGLFVYFGKDKEIIGKVVLITLNLFVVFAIVTTWILYAN